MSNYFCFSCHNNLTYISYRRLMCFSCEKIYGEDHFCRRCTAQKKTKVFMEVVEPGTVRCVLCGTEQDAPGLNFETSMKRESISRIQRTLSSIPPQTSTGPGRAPGVSTIGAARRRLDESGVGGSETFRPRSIRPSSSASQSIAQFPPRADPDLIESTDGLIVVAEFPRHTHETEIMWHVEQGKLFLTSKLEGCPYRDEIELPEWADEPHGVQFKNGILELVFKKDSTAKQ